MAAVKKPLPPFFCRQAQIAPILKSSDKTAGAGEPLRLARAPEKTEMRSNFQFKGESTIRKRFIVSPFLMLWLPASSVTVQVPSADIATFSPSILTLPLSSVPKYRVSVIFSTVVNVIEVEDSILRHWL